MKKLLVCLVLCWTLSPFASQGGAAVASTFEASPDQLTSIPLRFGAKSPLRLTELELSSLYEFDETAFQINGDTTGKKLDALKGLNARPVSSPDWDGIVQDTKYLVLYQASVVVVLYFMPEDISNWSAERKKADHLKKYNENIKDTGWDEDKWAVNYIGHPYFGAVYYVRARNRGYDSLQSLWYSALMSVMFEFGVEALFEPPSVQDLIVTPLAGSLIGEYFMRSRDKILTRIESSGELKGTDRLVLFLTDPMDWLNSKTRRLLGKDSDFSLQPVIMTNHHHLSVTPTANATNATIGLQFRLTW